MSMQNSLATKDSGLRTQGPATRTRSRVGTAPPSPFTTPHRSTALRLFDVPPIEGALSSQPPLVIDCADAHARDIQLAHAHAVPFSYLEQRARQEPWGPAGSTWPCGATITAKARLILINWLAEVTSSIPQKIADETLHLAVNYLDRFLFKSPGCNIGHLQLVGVTSLLIGECTHRSSLHTRIIVDAHLATVVPHAPRAISCRHAPTHSFQVRGDVPHRNRGPPLRLRQNVRQEAGPQLRVRHALQ